MIAHKYSYSGQTHLLQGFWLITPCAAVSSICNIVIASTGWEAYNALCNKELIDT